MDMPVVRVNRKGAGRAASGHPWIFSSDVMDRSQAAPGDTVKVTGPDGRALGVAHYSSKSQIALRLLSRRVETVDPAFWRRRLEAALALRRRLYPESDVYRLVHGEGDLLPGLVVDRYGGCLVLQTLDQGMDRAREEIAACLREMLAPLSVVLRNDAAVRAREDLPRETRLLWGDEPGEVAIELNGLRLRVRPLEGQKTGMYLDQRDNYVAAARHARGRALDCFCSTGGFALHLARTCESVEAVDSSAAALGIAAANARDNGLTVEWREANAFDLLAGYAAANRRFDAVVLDPPAFAKSRANLEAAVRGYKEINLRALRLLGPGGVLVTCSCSFHMSEAMLLETVAEAALDAGKTLRVLDRRTQAGDHPILLTVPETHYLKCLILEVV